MEQLSKAATFAVIASQEFSVQLAKLRILDQRYNELRKLINDKSLIEIGLEYFNRRYSQSLFKHPGKHSYIELLIQCAKTGMSAREIFESSILIIDQYFDKMLYAYTLCRRYEPDYSSAHPMIQSYRYNGCEFEIEISECDDIFNDIVFVDSKDYIKRYKAWEHPYKYHK